MEKYKLYPFDKVLVRSNKSDTWVISLFSRKCEDGRFETINGYWNLCIPYEEHEYLLGTNWEDNPKYRPKDFNYTDDSIDLDSIL